MAGGDNGLAQAFGKEPTDVEEVVEETPEVVEEAPAETTEEVFEEAPEKESEEVVVAENTLEATAEETPAEEAPTPAPAFDPLAWFKEQTGFDDPATMKAELEEARKPKELQFANEESKRIHEALIAGKEEEVTEYLYTKKLLKGAEKLPVEDKLKLKMKLEYPDFDDEDLAVQFEAQYGFNEDDYDEALVKSEKKKHAATLKAAAAKADEFFKGYQTQIELPKIEQPAPPAAEPAGPTQEELDKAAKWVENFNTGLAQLKPEQAAIKTRFSDEANKMQFDIAYTPDAKGFEAAKEAAKNVSAWLDKNFLDAEGNLRLAELARLIYRHENAEKVDQGILTQAKNSFLRWQLANGKQIDLKNGTQRQYTAQPVSEIQRVRDQVFGK